MPGSEIGQGLSIAGAGMLGTLTVMALIAVGVMLLTTWGGK